MCVCVCVCVCVCTKDVNILCVCDKDRQETMDNGIKVTIGIINNRYYRY